MAGHDRLSNLSDDLLRRILYFVPTKEATSTGVLARRWHDLWRSSGAVNLVARLRRGQEKALSSSRRTAFVDAAEAVLAHADAPVTRLTIRMETDRGVSVSAIDQFLHGDMNRRQMNNGVDVVRALVRHRAVRRVEELHVAVAQGSSSRSLRRGIDKLRSLPSSETIRVLDLTCCKGFRLKAVAALPRLRTLQLRLCAMRAKRLQALLDAAPVLATVNLDSISFNNGRIHSDSHRASTAEEPPAVHLRFPATTVLSLESCSTVTIDAPKLQYFRYRGYKRGFWMTSPCLERVDAHLRDDYEDKDAERGLFWQFVQNFAGARSLKLKVNNLNNIAVTSRNKQTDLLCLFPNAKRLEVEGMHAPTSKTAGVAIANLLRCCPVLAGLTLKLSIVSSDLSNDSSDDEHPFVDGKAQLDYNKSIHRFMRRTSKPMISLDNSYGNKSDELSHIPGLSGQSFACVQSSLRRVGLKFPLDSSNCLGVRLVKFFANNAVVLQELCLHSGSRRLNEHMNLDVEGWIAANSSKVSLKRKNMAESSWEFSKIPRVSLDSTTADLPSATGFTVKPLQS